MVKGAAKLSDVTLHTTLASCSTNRSRGRARGGGVRGQGGRVGAGYTCQD